MSKIAFALNDTHGEMQKVIDNRYKFARRRAKWSLSLIIGE
jgi:hypothetical protein